MTSDPRQEGPDDGKAFAEPESVEEVADSDLASAQEEASQPELDEAEAFGSFLTKHQCEVLRGLLGLLGSLRGPQALLETAGHFTRPFPPRPIISRG